MLSPYRSPARQLPECSCRFQPLTLPVCLPTQYLAAHGTPHCQTKGGVTLPWTTRARKFCTEHEV